MTFDTLYVNPNGRTARGPYTGAVITLLAAFAFYYFLVPGLTSHWCQLILLFPAVVLHARRLHDMGRTAWLLIVPAALIIATFWLKIDSPGTQVQTIVAWAAIIVSAGFVVWGLAGKSRA
jgi:uncharacterized membrane protein YhaH (DUF805 family)